MKSAVLFLVLCVFSSARELPIAKHPQRALVLKNLQLLVDDRAKEEENHFFACSVDGHDWIFWREGRLLMPTTFAPAVDDKEISADQIWEMRLRYCRKPIDLDSGVVPKREGVGSSTFLVMQEFASRIVYACTLDGELVVVRKKKPNKAPEPTSTSVTPRASARVAPAALVAHL